MPQGQDELSGRKQPDDQSGVDHVEGHLVDQHGARLPHNMLIDAFEIEPPQRFQLFVTQQRKGVGIATWQRVDSGSHPCYGGLFLQHLNFGMAAEDLLQ